MASKEPEEKYSNTKTGEETLAFEKRRSKSRRVSFAETTAIHLFIRDEECDTPPEVEDSSNGRLLKTESDEIRELLASSDDDSDGGGDDDARIAVESSFLRPLESPSPGSYFGSATSNDEDNFFGPVSADFIKPGRLSDSAASDANHDVTMDSTAFSMHYRSLARSDSGGEFKTPTGVRLAFGDRTSDHISTITSGGDRMVLTASGKRVSGSSLLADTVNGSGNSDDMSVVGENPHKYDYGELPPELDILLAEDGKVLGAVSLTSHAESPNSTNSLQVDARSSLQQNELKLLDTSNRDIDAHLVSDMKKAFDGAIFTVHVNIDNGNDDSRHASLGETTRNTSIQMDDETLILPAEVMPVDKYEEERKGAAEASGKFQSPLPSSKSNINYEQPVAGSVSSLLAKRRQIFRVTSNDKSNLIVSEKKYDVKESKHTLSASSFEKGVSKLKRLEAFPFVSSSKVEGNISRLMPSESVSSSLIRNYRLKYGSKDFLLNHMAAPVASLDKDFSDVAKDDGEIESADKMDIQNLKILGDAQYATLSSHDKSSKLSGVSVSPLALSKEKRLEPSVSRDNHTKGTVLFNGSDCTLLEITLDDLTAGNDCNLLDNQIVTQGPDNSAFSTDTSAEKKVSASPLYQASPSTNLNQQAKSSLRRDQDVKQDADDLAARHEFSSSLLIERKKEAERSSSNIKHSKMVSQEMGQDESVMPSSYQAALMDKVSESCEPVTNVETETTSTSAVSEKNTRSFTGSATTSDNNPNELPAQMSESCKEELSCSLLKKKPCYFAEDSNVHVTVENTVLTPRPCQLTSRYDEKDQHALKPSNFYGNDNSTNLKRKLSDEAAADNDEVATFLHKPKLCKDQTHCKGDNEALQSIGVDATARDWVDVFTSFRGMTELLPSLIDKLTLAQIRMLNDIFVNLDKMRSYQLLNHDIFSQKAFDSASVLRIKRLVDTKLLLHKSLYQKAKLQLMRLERDKLLDRVCQLDSRVEESKMLISSCQGLCIRGEKDVEIDCFRPESCPFDLSKTTLGAAEIPSLRKKLEVSETKIRNLNKSFNAYIKAIKEPTCTDTTAPVKNFLRKRVACRSLQSDFQLCQVGNVKAMDGKPNILFDHGGIMSQRFIVNSISTNNNGLCILNTLNNIEISKMFLGTDVCTAFSFVLCGETSLTYSGFRIIAQETQKSSLLLHTLLDVVEEVELAMIELKNLTVANFLQPSAGKLVLRLCFTDFSSGARVALNIDITCLKRAIYPSEVLPYEVQGTGPRRHKSFQLLLDEIKSSVRSVKCGYMRILNLCRCVSETIQANCMSYEGHRQ